MTSGHNLLRSVFSLTHLTPLLFVTRGWGWRKRKSLFFTGERKRLTNKRDAKGSSFHPEKESPMKRNSFEEDCCQSFSQRWFNPLPSLRYFPSFILWNSAEEALPQKRTILFPSSYYHFRYNIHYAIRNEKCLLHSNFLSSSSKALSSSLSLRGKKE